MHYESIIKLCSVVEEPYLVPASPGRMMMERADFCCIDSKLPGARPRDSTLHRYHLSDSSLHCAFKVRCSLSPFRHKELCRDDKTNNILEMEYNIHIQYRLPAAQAAVNVLSRNTLQLDNFTFTVKLARKLLHKYYDVNVSLNHIKSYFNDNSLLKSIVNTHAHTIFILF